MLRKNVGVNPVRQTRSAVGAASRCVTGGVLPSDKATQISTAQFLWISISYAMWAPLDKMTAFQSTGELVRPRGNSRPTIEGLGVTTNRAKRVRRSPHRRGSGPPVWDRTQYHNRRASSCAADVARCVFGQRSPGRHHRAKPTPCSNVSRKQSMSCACCMVIHGELRRRVAADLPADILAPLNRVSRMLR